MACFTLLPSHLARFIKSIRIQEKSFGKNTVAGKHVVLRWILNEIWFGVVPIMAFLSSTSIRWHLYNLSVISPLFECNHLIRLLVKLIKRFLSCSITLLG